MATVLQIARYPLKGANAQRLDRVALTPGAGLPGDRRFALLRPGAKIEPHAFAPKSAFFQLARDPRLAAIDVAWEEETQHLQIRRAGRPVARGQPLNPVGRALLDQFFAAYLGAVGGAPKIVARGDAFGLEGFWDVEEPLVSILNLASLREVSRVGGAEAEPARFRGNLLVDLGRPWAEDALAGRRFTIGAAAFEGVEPITRCAATNVAPAGEPDAGARDRNYPKLLNDAFGRGACGLYARVVGAGAVAVGDALVAEP